MEIPLELMLTISQKLPWMFFPDIIPVGHPIFDIINSTNPEVIDFSLTIRNLKVHFFNCFELERFNGRLDVIDLMGLFYQFCCTQFCFCFTFFRTSCPLSFVLISVSIMEVSNVYKKKNL